MRLPRVLLALLISALAFSGCDRTIGSNPDHDKFSDPKCDSSAIRIQFLVQWKSGDVTVERAADIQTFFKEVLVKREKEIVSAEYDRRIYLPEPQGPQFSGNDVGSTIAEVNWGLHKIEVESIWPQSVGVGVTVAVVDSGVDIYHQQLKNQLYVNSAEQQGKAGIDDDSNGFIDDINGWDFVQNSGTVTDVGQHGTHVAGVIAAEHIGPGKVMGVAPGAKLLPLNFIDNTRSGTLGNALRAIDYAVQKGARVINASWGGITCSTILQNKIEELGRRGILFVAAAGNEFSDLDLAPSYPAAYEFPHQITVGASTQGNLRADFSNFSARLVHLLAPGVDIISTVAPDDSSPSKGGTSMATPFVSGAAALLFSSRPSATPEQIKNAILQSVDTSDYINEVQSHGRLNVRKAYELLNVTAPK